MTKPINHTVLMSGTEYFDDSAAINPFMDSTVSIDHSRAAAEHSAIRAALQSAGVTVRTIAPPPDCQDGVYTANWALVRGNTAVLSRLPNARKDEEAYAAQTLSGFGKNIIYTPDNLRFSGQGDALPCGDYLFTGSSYRTDPAVHAFLAQTLGYTVISLQTIPLLDAAGTPATNAASGWPDSYFYDIDLALAVIAVPSETQKGLVAWCPEAFTADSHQRLQQLDAVDKIEVSLAEAKDAFACNLVSTGARVIMSAHAPLLSAELKRRGLDVVTPEVSELAKGGGYIRCTTLTLDNA